MCAVPDARQVQPPLPPRDERRADACPDRLRVQLPGDRRLPRPHPGVRDGDRRLDRAPRAPRSHRQRLLPLLLLLIYKSMMDACTYICAHAQG